MDYIYSELKSVKTTEVDVPNEQATFTLVKNATTNNNDITIEDYEAILLNETTYKILYKGFRLNEEKAKTYMQFMTGSNFLPTYNEEKPQNSVITMADLSMWSPLFDEEYGLRLIKVENEIATKEYVNEIVGDIETILNNLNTGSGVE